MSTMWKRLKFALDPLSPSTSMLKNWIYVSYRVVTVRKRLINLSNNSRLRLHMPDKSTQPKLERWDTLSANDFSSGRRKTMIRSLGSVKKVGKKSRLRVIQLNEKKLPEKRRKVKSLMQSKWARGETWGEEKSIKGNCFTTHWIGMIRLSGEFSVKSSY